VVARVWALVALLVLVLTGCGTADAGPDPAVRTDREPITQRFPQLGDFTEVHWLGGRLGDDRVPGPSTYTIEAVLDLAPDDLARLRTRYSFLPGGGPVPPEPLRPFAGPAPGPWSTSPELDAAAGPPGWASHVWLRFDTGTAYVSAKGE
jgi:hypothetical protein